MIHKNQSRLLSGHNDISRGYLRICGIKEGKAIKHDKVDHDHHNIFLNFSLK